MAENTERQGRYDNWATPVFRDAVVKLYLGHKATDRQLAVAADMGIPRACLFPSKCTRTSATPFDEVDV